MNIADVLKPERILVDLEINDKYEGLTSIVEVLKGNEAVIDLDKITSAIIEREKIMSTGVGSGFAIPHGKTNGVRGILAAFAKLSTPIDFESIDDDPVDLIFLLVGEEGLVSPHIKLLSKISRLMNKKDFRENLKTLSTADEIYNFFRSEEEKINPR